MTAKPSATSKTPASTKKTSSAADSAASQAPRHKPVRQQAAAKAPVEQKPAAQAPAAQKPAQKKPAQKSPAPKTPAQKKAVTQKPAAPATNSAQLAAPAAVAPKPRTNAPNSKKGPHTLAVVETENIPAVASSSVPARTKAPWITKKPPVTPSPAYLVAAKPTHVAHTPVESPVSTANPAEAGALSPSRWHKLIPALVLVPVLAAAGTLLVLGNGGPTPVGDAQQWVAANATSDQSIVVADDMAGQFPGSGADAAGVVAYSDLMAWRDADYVVTGPSLAESSSATLEQAVANSTVVASFGAGSQRVDVRMVTPQGAVLAAAAQTQASADRAAYGAELAVNPALQISDEGRELLTAGRVDPRIVVVLATLIADGGITVGGFPVIDGEQAGTIRQVQITKIAGERVAFGDEFAGATQDILTNLSGPYAPSDVTAEGDAVLLRYPLDLDPLAD
jgi:hypothetical protein